MKTFKATIKGTYVTRNFEAKSLAEAKKQAQSWGQNAAGFLYKGVKVERLKK